MVFERKYRIDQEAEDSAMHINKNLKRKNFTWINDAIYVSQLKKLFLITSGRELRIFNISSEYLSEEYSLNSNH